MLGFGGVLTTVTDLHRWHIALKQNRVLSAESVDKLFTPYVDEGDDGKSYYGYGWVIADEPEFGKVIWHDGANDSHNAVFLDYADRQIMIVVLSNRIDGAPDAEIFYGTDTGFSLSRTILTDEFSEYPDYLD